MSRSKRRLGALIVDDEPLARARLVEILTAMPHVEIAGEAANATEALKAIRSKRPDVVFLDIEMPGRSGLELAAELGSETAIIFTTAHHEYAYDAFGVEAIDYVLKPFGKARISQAIERVFRRGAAAVSSARADDTSSGRRDAQGRDAVRPLVNRLLLQHRGKIVPVQIDHVVRLSAQGDYCEVYANNHVYLAGRSLGGMLDGLPDQFVRVHRSHAVNIAHVKALESLPDGRLQAQLSDGSRVVASRRQSRVLRQRVL